MSMCNIAFQVLRLSICVFNKCSGIIILTIIFVIRSLKGFGWNNVGQRSRWWPRNTSALGQCIVLSGVSDAGI